MGFLSLGPTGIPQLFHSSGVNPWQSTLLTTVSPQFPFRNCVSGHVPASPRDAHHVILQRRVGGVSRAWVMISELVAGSSIALRTAAPEDRAGTSAPDSALLLAISGADERHEPRFGAASGVQACVGAALVGGGDPPQQPELVAGSRRGCERRARGQGRVRAALLPFLGTRVLWYSLAPSRASGRGGPVVSAQLSAQHSAAQTCVSFRAEPFQPCPLCTPSCCAEQFRSYPRIALFLPRCCCVRTRAKWGSR